MASISRNAPSSRMKPYTMQKIGTVYGRFFITGEVWGYIPEVGDYAPVGFITVWWNGNGWTQSQNVGTGKVGDLYLWQRIFSNTQVITKIRKKKGNMSNADNRFYDDTLDEILGGVKQTLGA